MSKQDNFRFSFLLKLECEATQTSDIASELPGTVMAFKQTDETCWLNITVDPASKPLSRKYFRGECKGAKILAKANSTLLEEITPALIDRTLKQLAGDSAVIGLNEAAIAWLS